MPLDHVSVLVLAWNNRAYTLDALRSLAAQTLSHTVYVVDNASIDGTSAAVARCFPAARCIRNAVNLGFAAGTNVGMAAAFADGADAVLALNNDATLAPDALAQLVRAAERHSEAGLLVPLILSARPPHRVQAAGATINRWTGRSNCRWRGAARTAIPDQIARIAGVMGCALLITRACYERIGGFNESLCLYFEDTEYAMRATDAGFAILFVPGSVVYHHGSLSLGVKAPDVLYFMMRNSLVTMDRYRPLPAPVAAVRRAVMLLLMLFWMLLPPRGMARVGDLLGGYRDARRGRLGPRDGSD